MSDQSAQPPSLEGLVHQVLNGFRELQLRVSENGDAFSNFGTAFTNQMEQVRSLLGSLKPVVDNIVPVINELRPWLQRIDSQLAELRTVSLGRIDDIKGTLDLLREDIRTNWATADFAISNSRNGREDVDKLIQMVSALQRSQQLLTSQVDELRKAAQEREAGLRKEP